MSSLHKFYFALGEETTRGTAETTTVSFLPLLSAALPIPEYDDQVIQEFRGEEHLLGQYRARRMSKKWTASIETPAFAEGGSAANGYGLLFKHLFGEVTSASVGTGTAYAHIFYPASDPFGSSGDIGTKALTFNYNLDHGESGVKLRSYTGGRISQIKIDIEPGQPVKLSVDAFGQEVAAEATAIASPTYPANSKRFDYYDVGIYDDRTATGTAPDYTAFDVSAATQIKPDKISITLSNNWNDILRVAGVDYPDLTRRGIFAATVELTLSWDKVSGQFSSIDEFKTWLDDEDEAATRTLHVVCDNGVAIETGYNYKLHFDFPKLRRTAPSVDYPYDGEPTATLTYEAMYSADDEYACAVLLQNSATSI